MTTITITTSEYGNRTLRCNGRHIKIEPWIAKIEKVSAGHWEGEDRNGHSFELFGGWAAGGSPREWFVKYSVLGDFHMKATSAAAALRLIENA